MRYYFYFVFILILFSCKNESDRNQFMVEIHDNELKFIISNYIENHSINGDSSVVILFFDAGGYGIDQFSISYVNGPTTFDFGGPVFLTEIDQVYVVIHQAFGSLVYSHPSQTGLEAFLIENIADAKAAGHGFNFPYLTTYRRCILSEESWQLVDILDLGDYSIPCDYELIKLLVNDSVSYVVQRK